MRWSFFPPASRERRSGIPGVGAVLMAVAGTGAWVVGSEIAAALDLEGRDGWPTTAADTVFTQPRPFLHGQHQAVACTQCHRSPAEPGIVTIRAPQDCAACHHDPGRGYGCQACHTPAQISAPRAVESRMSLTVWAEPRSRTLPFDHDLHTPLACRDCHTSPATLAVGVQCAACHQDHHRPEAECTACHLPAGPAVHGLEVHLTCASSGCHADTAGERPALSRNLCLACHVAQRAHEPGMACHLCHMVPEEPPVRPADAAVMVPEEPPVRPADAAVRQGSRGEAR